MKITEITKSKIEVLRESMESQNLSEEVISHTMRIAEQHESDDWSDSLTAEQLVADNDALMKSLGVEIE